MSRREDRSDPVGSDLWGCLFAMVLIAVTFGATMWVVMEAVRWLFERL